MSDGIVIYGVPNDDNNDRVRRTVVRLTGVNVSIVFCPPSVRDLYRMPFIEDEGGGRHFGVDGIDQYVTRRLAGQGVC